MAKKDKNKRENHKKSWRKHQRIEKKPWNFIIIAMEIHFIRAEGKKIR